MALVPYTPSGEGTALLRSAATTQVDMLTGLTTAAGAVVPYWDQVGASAAGMSGTGAVTSPDAAVAAAGKETGLASNAIMLPADPQGYKAIAEFGAQLFCPNDGYNSVWNYGQAPPPSATTGTGWVLEGMLSSQNRDFVLAASNAACQDTFFSVAYGCDMLGEGVDAPARQKSAVQWSGKTFPYMDADSDTFKWEKLDLGMSDCQLLRADGSLAMGRDRSVKSWDASDQEVVIRDACNEARACLHWRMQRDNVDDLPPHAYLRLPDTWQRHDAAPMDSPAWHKNLGIVKAGTVPGALSVEEIIQQLIRCLAACTSMDAHMRADLRTPQGSVQPLLWAQGAVAVEAACDLLRFSNDHLLHLDASWSMVAPHRGGPPKRGVPSPANVECARRAQLYMVMATQLLMRQYATSLFPFSLTWDGFPTLDDHSASINRIKDRFIADLPGMQAWFTAATTQPKQSGARGRFGTSSGSLVQFQPELHLAQRLDWEHTGAGSILTLGPGLGECITGTSNLWHFMHDETASKAVGRARRNAAGSKSSSVIRLGAVDLFYCWPGADGLRLYICDHSNLCTASQGDPANLQASHTSSDEAIKQIHVDQGGSSSERRSPRPTLDVNDVLGHASIGYARGVTPQQLADELLSGQSTVAQHVHRNVSSRQPERPAGDAGTSSGQLRNVKSDPSLDISANRSPSPALTLSPDQKSNWRWGNLGAYFPCCSRVDLDVEVETDPAAIGKLRSLDRPHIVRFVDGLAATYVAEISIQHGFLEWGIEYRTATAAIKSYVAEFTRRINMVQVSVLGTGATLGLGPVVVKAVDAVKLPHSVPRDQIITTSSGLEQRLKRDFAHTPGIMVHFPDQMCRAVEELLATSENLYLKTLGDFGGWGQLFEGNEDAVVLPYTSQRAAAIHMSKLERSQSRSGRLAVAGTGRKYSKWFWGEVEQLDSGDEILRIGSRVPETEQLTGARLWGSHHELLVCGGEPRQPAGSAAP